jgi:hypothetical protein
MTQILSAAPRLDRAPSIEERCDRCAAAAKLLVDLSTGGTLAFCGHHGNQHAGEITRHADRVVVAEDFEWRGGI